MPHNQQKKIAVINDLCGFGRCSITAALPIISAMKIQCCPLPTAVFSNHTEFDSFRCTDFTAYMDGYIDEWLKLGLQFNGILTGFLSSPEQISIVMRFLEQFKGKNTIVVMDPAMGDNGSLYPTYSPNLAEQLNCLTSYADILTPNLTEACILTQTDYHPHMQEAELAIICEKISTMGPEKIVISGLERGDYIENFVFEAGKVPITVRERKTGPSRSGTGDVFASMIAADAVNGAEFVNSVCHASSFIAKVLRRTSALALPETDGICFEEFLSEIEKTER